MTDIRRRRTELNYLVNTPNITVRLRLHDDRRHRVNVKVHADLDRELFIEGTWFDMTIAVKSVINTARHDFERCAVLLKKRLFVHVVLRGFYFRLRDKGR